MSALDLWTVDARRHLDAFTRLRALREFQRKHIAFLSSSADWDLACEIGYHQCAGDPLTVNRLLVMGLASVATVQRRLRRLRAAGALHQLRSKLDRRVVTLHLSPKALAALVACSDLLSDPKPPE